SILLPNGKVLIVGGYGPDSDGVERTELYDPATGAFASAGDYVLPDYCDFCAPAVRLADGKKFCRPGLPCERRTLHSTCVGVRVSGDSIGLDCDRERARR